MKQEQEQKYEVRYVYPDTKVFSDEATLESVVMPSRVSLNSGSAVFAFERAEYPETGGILRYYHACLYPEKGFAIQEAIHACNMSKRYLLGMLRMFAGSKKLMVAGSFELERIIATYNGSCDHNLAPFWYKGEYPRYYSPVCKEIRKFLLSFLQFLGVSEYEAERFARNMMTMIDNDNAYRYRVQDIGGMTSKLRLMHDFVGEFERVYKEYLRREVPAQAVNDKIGSVLKLAKIAWFIPKFRKAVLAGLEAMDWQNVVMDDADKYHTLLWSDYNFQGRTFEDRRDEFIAMHPEGKLPIMIKLG
jgi:hypothetical protein